LGSRHGRGSGGETPYGWPGYEVDMNFHKRDVKCCDGDGVIVGDRSDHFGALSRMATSMVKLGVFLYPADLGSVGILLQGVGMMKMSLALCSMFREVMV